MDAAGRWSRRTLPIRVAVRRIGGLPGRALKEGIAAGLSEQRVDLSAEFPVAGAGMIEESSPLTGILIESRMIDGLHPFPSFGIHLLASLALPAWWPMDARWASRLENSKATPGRECFQRRRFRKHGLVPRSRVSEACFAQNISLTEVVVQTRDGIPPSARKPDRANRGLLEGTQTVATCASILAPLRGGRSQDAETGCVAVARISRRKRQILYFQSVVNFPSWTSRVRVPSPSPSHSF